MYDCAIIGGGPAGLNAALILGRARRSVALLDNNKPRNAVTQASHGFITRDGIQPSDFRRIAYEEVLRYPSVEHWEAEVIDVRKNEQRFEIMLQSGRRLQSKKLILATGLAEVFPEIKGFQDFYGKSVFNCPYCDGWELRDQPLVLISNDIGTFHMAKMLYQWSKDMIVCTNGYHRLAEEQVNRLEEKNIRIIEAPIDAFFGNKGKLEYIQFKDGTRIHRSGGFIKPVFRPKVCFADQLGYVTLENGGIATDEVGRSNVYGLYAAGDAVYVGPSQLVFAAASGSRAAMAVNMDLVEEEFI